LIVVGAIGLLVLGSVLGILTVGERSGRTEVLGVAGCVPKNPARAVVNVQLTDRGGVMMGGSNLMMVSVIASPDSVSSGAVTFEATNTGAMNHELLILPAPSDGVGTRKVSNDGKISESSSLGEASTSCGQGAGDGISPGSTSWVTIHLAPGTYELLCDEPWHYANGMFTTFVVS
jgi:uncharacterized cupredoxin-like copper-binding protein